MTIEMDLSVEAAGIRFASPLVLSEGPLTGNARLIRRAAEHPLGAIVTKSIRQEAAASPNPYMIAAGKGLINADWTDIGFNAWLRELDTLDLPVPLITNVATNHCPPQKAAELAEVLQDHGAALVTFSDYEPENLVEAVRLARRSVRVPIMVKLPPFIKEVGGLCKRLEAAGVSMIAAMDAVGPAMDIDLASRAPVLGCDGAYGYLSAAPIFPLTLAYVAEIASSVSVPVLGVGGVTRAADVLKLIMAGATCVGIVGGAIIHGLGIFDRIEGDLRAWMAENGVRSLSEIRGCALGQLHRPEAYGRKAWVDPAKCTGCGRCEKSCYAGAMGMERGKASVNCALCSGCGVCMSICPAGAASVAP